MSGFDNDVCYFNNIQVGQTQPVTAGMTADGELLIGNGAGNPVIATLTAGAGISIVNGGGSITIAALAASAIDQITVDSTSGTGVNPVVPAAGAVTFTGAQIAAAAVANTININSNAPNQLEVQVQRSSAQAGTTLSANGVCHFDSSSFAVDANGFVTLAGGSLAIDSVTVQATSGTGTNPVLPTALGLITINGAAVAAQSIPIQSKSFAANSLQIEVQRAAASTGTDATSQGLSSFDDTQFSVDANGYVTSLNGLEIAAINVDANTGPGTDPVVPTAAGVVTVTGAQVAAGTVGVNVIRTDSLAANTYTIEIQRSAAVASSLPANNGVCHFDSSDFTVDANGFVSLVSGVSPWVDSAGGALTNHTGYFATAAAVFTLPTGTANGDMVEIVDVVGGGVILTAPGAQIIQIGSSASSAGGTATSTAIGDSLRLSFRLADLTWYQVPGAQGTWTLA